MNPANPSLSRRRSRLFTCEPAALLESVCDGGPLYLHVRNLLAELAAILPLRGMSLADGGQTALFPESGMVLSLAAVEAIHGIEVRHRESDVSALEFAAEGDPRAVAIAAIPGVSEMERFAAALEKHASIPISDHDYARWREDFTVPTRICPCCKAAAEERRAAAESNPLTRILCNSIEERRPLRCELHASTVRFASWVDSGNLRISNGFVGLVGADSRSMLEVDVGLCHLLRIVTRRIDGEPFSIVEVHDSLGRLQLEIAAPDPEVARIWRELCR